MGIFGNKDLENLKEKLSSIKANLSANRFKTDPSTATAVRDKVAEATTLVDRLRSKGKSADARAAIMDAQGTAIGLSALGANPADAQANMDAMIARGETVSDATQEAWQRILAELLART